MSNKLFPSQVHGIIREGKLLGLSFAPQGTGAPLIVSGNGMASVTRNSAGNFTVKLQNQFRSLVSATAGLQVAASSGDTSASYTWVDSTDTNSTTFTAGTSFPGALGNNLKVAVLTGASLSNSITTVGGITTVNLTINTGTTTPALLQTYVNTTAAATLSPYISISAISGTTPYSVFLAATALTGGASSGALQAVITAANVTGAGANTQSVIIQVQDANAVATDISANAGNLVNLMLFVKSAGVAYSAGGVE
jgi:hypothetical protein